MAKMITATQWAYFKEHFPEQVAKMNSITIPAEAWQLKSFWKAKKKGKLLADHADPVGALIKWCEDTLEENFYAEKANDEWWVKAIKFHFFSEDDAILFKLTWWNDAQL